METSDEQMRIGRYATRRVLGSGAFATVWLARDDELDVPVAIKVLAENWTHNADVRARFVEEARILRRLNDPRVVGVHDIGVLDDGRSYFVMDFADGGTLADLVGVVDRRTALEFAVEVGRAVQVLHDHQILHRDVKPSNLLLRRRPGQADQLMVTDLGTAKALAEASGLTVSAGTPAFMAPEQAHGELPLSPRADVYGVAAVAYAMVSGRPPFPHERGLTDVALRDSDRRPEPLDGGPLDALLGRALSFDPAQRPASALELAERFSELAAGHSRGTGGSNIGSGSIRRPPRADATTRVAADPDRPGHLGRAIRRDAPVVASDRRNRPEVRAPIGSGRLIALAAVLFVVSALLVWILLGVL